MIPVDQTVFGGKFGNCHAACIASILELPLWKVPSLCHLESGWCERLGYWLGRHGLRQIIMLAGDGFPSPEIARAFGNHYLIAGGPAARGLGHSVVYRGFHELAHDPHPSRAGLLSVEDYTLITLSEPSRAAWLLRFNQ